jgi:hypothetical protein
MIGPIDPTGFCWCGCGEKTPDGSYFVPGHDKRAESEVIKRIYGSVAGMVETHRRYSTDLFVYTQSKGFHVTCPVLDLAEDGREVLEVLRRMKTRVVKALEERDLRGELLHPSSFAISSMADEVFKVTVDHPSVHVSPFSARLQRKAMTEVRRLLGPGANAEVSETQHAVILRIRSDTGKEERRAWEIVGLCQIDADREIGRAVRDLCAKLKK